MAGHNSRNRICPKFSVSSPVGRVSVDIRQAPNQPILNLEQNPCNNDEEENENENLAEEEVLDEVDVDDGVASEEITNEGWTLTDFQDEGILPDFDRYHGVNLAFMHSNNCLSCFDSFACFFDDNVMRAFVTASQNWGQTNFASNWKPFTESEFKTFLAIILVLGLIPVSSRDSVWDENGLGIPFIKSIMSKRRFNQILRAWRYNDESGLTADQIKNYVKDSPFWYVKSFVDTLREKFRAMYMLGQKVDIDEQCIPWKGRHIARCYNPKKPEKWHFKCYALNDASTGYMHNVYLYEGSAENRPANVPATLYPIHKLFQPIEKYYNKNHIVATDNWYTSLAVLKFVRDDLCNNFVGTCKTNKKGIPKDGIFPKVGRGKQQRGACRQMMQNSNGKFAYFISWQDNKPVHILSTIKSGLRECQRRVQNDYNNRWERMAFQQPSIIKTYNTRTGGTDSFDQRLSYYRPSLKTRRYPPRVFVHFLNASVVNAYIIHREYHKTEKTFQLRNFIENLVFELAPQADNLASQGVPPIFKRRKIQWEQQRIRLDKNEIHAPFIEELPDKALNIKHFRSRCVICQNKSNVRCLTCGAYLCVKGKYSDGIHEVTCWMKFHTKVKLSENDEV